MYHLLVVVPAWETYGPVHGMCNYVYNAKHTTDVGRLS
jgi:hypothetical protein